MKNVIEKHAYTLLADDTLPMACNPDCERLLKAHLTLGTLTNSTVMLSDNQLVNGLNLRRLLATDDTVRSLVENSALTFALRATDGSEAMAPGARLLATEAAFRAEPTKFLLPDAIANDPRPFSLIDHHGKIVDWTYEQVRTNYTNQCKQLLFDKRCRAKLGDQAHDALIDLVLDEEVRDQGLGRAFLRNRLPHSMAARGFPLTSEQQAHILDCIQAPYLSNLPGILNRNPIYEPRHQSSFELMRGIDFKYVDVEAPRLLRTRLDTRHFVEGLARLEPDDINTLRAHTAFQKYITLATEAESYSAFIDLRQAFAELTIVIDDRIFMRFPELHSSNRPEAREMRTRVATANYSIGFYLDFMSLTVGIPPIGTLISVAVDLLRTRTGVNDTDLALQDAAQRKMFAEDLRYALAANGADQEITAVEEIVTTSSHAWETMVTI